MEYRHILRTADESRRGRYLTFMVGSETFGLETAFIEEVTGMQPVSPLPCQPCHVSGIVNLRGSILPVIDARLRFGMKPGVYTDETSIVVISDRNRRLGLIVDSVSGVQEISEADIVTPPVFSTGQMRMLKAIGRVEGEIKLLLDYGRLLSACDYEALKAVL